MFTSAYDRARRLCAQWQRNIDKFMDQPSLLLTNWKLEQQLKDSCAKVEAQTAKLNKRSTKIALLREKIAALEKKAIVSDRRTQVLVQKTTKRELHVKALDVIIMQLRSQK